VTGRIERAEVGEARPGRLKKPDACEELKEEQPAEVKTQSFFRQKQADLLAGAVIAVTRTEYQSSWWSGRILGWFKLLLIQLIDGVAWKELCWDRVAVALLDWKDFRNGILNREEGAGSPRDWRPARSIDGISVRE